MYVFARAPRSSTLFRTASDGGIWRVTRDAYVFAACWTDGDARRGAGLGCGGKPMAAQPER